MKPLSMFNLAIVFVITVLASPHSIAEEGAVTTIMLVRHAEKQTTKDDPELTAQGLTRAADLAKLLIDANITHIHSTPFNRTIQTAEPIANSLGLEVQPYDYKTLDTFAKQLIEQGGRHLVVGHSNTTPQLVELLGGEPGEPIEEASEFDRLYVVTITDSADQPPQVSTLVLRY